MKVLRNPRLVLPLVLITLLIGATTAYVAISANFINCASLEGGTCTGEEKHDGQTGDSDVINGSSGADIIAGGGGDDLIFGNDGADEIDGEDGNDTIFGGAGDDQLNDDGGDDTFWGGPGCDTYDDDTGHNTFIFQPGDVPGGCTETPPAPASGVDTTVCVFLGYSGTEAFDPASCAGIEPGEPCRPEPWEDGIHDPRTGGVIDPTNCDEVYGVVLPPQG